MALLGTFILLFGWFGFNAASTGAATDLRFAVVAVNTAIAAAFGATIGMAYVWLRSGKPDPGMMANGMLAGLVAITAPCAFVQPWAAALIGSIAGVIVVESVWYFERKAKIDDPVGAISVHGVCGVWGVLAVGLFADGSYGAGWNLTTSAKTASHGVTGLFYDVSLGGSQLIAQAIGAATICIVMFGIALAFFKIQDALTKVGSGRSPMSSSPASTCLRWACSPTRVPRLAHRSGRRRRPGPRTDTRGHAGLRREVVARPVSDGRSPVSRGEVRGRTGISLVHSDPSMSSSSGGRRKSSASSACAPRARRGCCSWRPGHRHRSTSIARRSGFDSPRTRQTCGSVSPLSRRAPSGTRRDRSPRTMGD